MGGSNIEYRINTASEKQIYMHLKDCNDNFLPPLDERVDLEEYSKKISNKCILLEAWADHVLVGFIAAYFTDNLNRSSFITNVSVLKDFIGMGLASELLNQCIKYAQKKDYKEIKLEVYKDNVQAIRLYEKFNFIDHGAKDDLRLMKLDIIKTTMTKH